MEREPGVALWRQIYQRLENDIRSGFPAAGDQFPREEDLAARFGVNRHTLRRAMAALQADGLIRIERGRGTFVADVLLDYPVSRRTRFSEILTAAEREPSAEMLRTAQIPASIEAAEALGLDEGSPLVLIETLRRADGAPLTLAEHYFPATRFKHVAETFRETGSVSQALAKHGVTDYFRASTRVTTRLPDDRVARLLQQAPTQPVLVTHSVNVDADEWPIEFSVCCYAGRRVQLVFKPD